MNQLYEFTVHLDRAPDDDGLDALCESGMDDTVPEIWPGGRAVLHVQREAESLSRAIVTAVADIERAGFRAVGIDSEDLVTLAGIAEKTSRSRESVRLLSLGKRGPGGFPAAVYSDSGRSLYSWAAVRNWFAMCYGPASVAVADTQADTLAAADLLLRARLLDADMSQLSSLISA